MQKFDHRRIIYKIMGTQERVLGRQGKRVIRVRAIEVPLYVVIANIKRESRCQVKIQQRESYILVSKNISGELDVFCSR